MSNIAELVEYEVMSWPNVEKLPHRFGGIEFRVNGHEIGHLHGNRQARLTFRFLCLCAKSLLQQDEHRFITSFHRLDG